MNRRDVIALLGGAAAVWPLALNAQQRTRDSVAQLSSRTYRLGTLTGNVPLSANSPDGTTLLNALAQRGYTLGTAWWLQQRLPAEQSDLPRFPEGLGDDLPSEEAEAEGTPAEVRARLAR